MPGKHFPAYLLAAAFLGSGCMSAFAADDLTPRPQRVFVEKPRIEDYADYNAFLVDIMEFRRQKQEKAAARAAASSAAAMDSAALAGVAIQDPDAGRALYDISGPESLDDALVRASKLPHPVYDEPERFGRTTSFSFPIPQMEGDEMADKEIQGQLQDLESVDPVVYEDETALDHTNELLAEDPDNSDDTTTTKSAEGSNGAYRVKFDIATRDVTDSDGNHIHAPQSIAGEIGYTVIRVFDIEVEYFKN